MDCQTNNLDNSLPFHQSLGLIQLIFVNYFLIEACSHKVCLKVGNSKPVERNWFATTPTTVREVVWGFTWLQLKCSEGVGLNTTLLTMKYTRGRLLSRRKPLKRETCHEVSTEQVNKIALSANDDKRIIQPDKIQTLACSFRAWGALGGQEQRGQTGDMRETSNGAKGFSWTSQMSERVLVMLGAF